MHCKMRPFVLQFMAFRVAFCGQTQLIRKPFGWYIKVDPVPEGGKLRLTAGGVSAANVTCGKLKLLQPSPKGANGVLGYAVAGSYGYAVCPHKPITLNLTTVNAVRPLRGRHHLRIHTASSASLHMWLSNVGRLRRPAAHCCHPKGLRMNLKRGSSGFF